MLKMAGDARLHGRKLGPGGEKALLLNRNNATAACMSEFIVDKHCSGRNKYGLGR